MKADYMLVCGAKWNRTADPQAGWELVEALESPDPRLRMLAQTLLVESAKDSMHLLEDALRAGVVSTHAAGLCMVELLQATQPKQP